MPAGGEWALVDFEFLAVEAKNFASSSCGECVAFAGVEIFAAEAAGLETRGCGGLVVFWYVSFWVWFHFCIIS